MKRLSALLLALTPWFCAAQNDSTLLLSPEKLEERDILFRDHSHEGTKVFSATRSLEDVDKQPFTVWVITGEEILRNGFVTLADVLRAAPGIRVSQPGNAVEGETFLMRGLDGNQYVKILINDVPIKPAVALGMPIGAQLPIRQAERIEVVYGPAGAIYGDEACAGVVNIILKETERPVFTQADLSFGRYSYNSLDLMFGGKLGRDKNIFRYSIYGSSTVRENSDYFYDLNLFNTKNYLPFRLDTNLYLQNASYRGENNPRDSIARLNVLPHESRMFGINLTWRGLHFTYHRLARFDRSATGLNPLAVSYANPSNRLAERMEMFSLSFQRKRNKRVTDNMIAFDSYQINNTSTSTFLFDHLSSSYYYIRQQEHPTMSDSAHNALIHNIYQNYGSERFAVANGFDLRVESRVSAALSSKLSITSGGQFHIGAGSPLNAYYPVPVTVSIDGAYTPPLHLPVQPAHDAVTDANLFAQLDWRSKHLIVTGGGALNFALFQGITPLPRLGILYQIDSTWSVRANGSTGLRNGSIYGIGNSYTYNQASGFDLQASNDRLKTEKIYSAECGVRVRKAGGGISELMGFWQSAYDLLRPGYIYQLPGIVNSWHFGFTNAPGLAQEYWGIQYLGKSETKHILNVTFGRNVAIVGGKTELFVQYARGKEWFGYNLPKTNDVLNQPHWTVQYRNFFTINQKAEVVIAWVHQSSSLSKSVLYKDFYQLSSHPGELKKYNSWDISLRIFLSKQFLVYCHVYNIFDQDFGGLDATGTADDLLYNPQPGRQVRFGVNYNMN